MQQVPAWDVDADVRYIALFGNDPITTDFTRSLNRYHAVRSHQAVLIGTAARLFNALSWAQAIAPTLPEERKSDWGSWDIAACVVRIDPRLLLCLDRALRGERPSYRGLTSSQSKARWADEVRQAVNVTLHEIIHSFASADRHRNIAEHNGVSKTAALARIHEGAIDLATSLMLNRYLRSLRLDRTVPGILAAAEKAGYEAESAFLRVVFSAIARDTGTTLHELTREFVNDGARERTLHSLIEMWTRSIGVCSDVAGSEVTSLLYAFVEAMPQGNANMGRQAGRNALIVIRKVMDTNRQYPSRDLRVL